MAGKGVKMKKILILIVLILIVGGGYLKYGQSKQPKKYSGPVEQVNLKLKWVHQAQFAGNYMAAAKGYYRDQGLEVKMTPFSFEDPTIESVASGRDTFGITGADEVVLARAKGVPIRAFGVIYKINPVTAYALKKSGITKPQDFVGKTVGLEKGINIEYLYGAMMQKLGIDRKKIKEVTIGYDAKELLAGTTDVSTGYIINEPHRAIEAGEEVNTILMADYGVNMYADVLFATEDTIKNKPELVERFLRATLKGWQYAIEHESEAVEETMKYVSDSTKSHEEYLLHASIPLIHTGTSPLGMMEAKQWEQVQTILLEQKILEKPIMIEEAYTMKFLDQIYKK
jgi:ABC-type nitrate/sulfonate/bicarbonate transport system substrate-binding protein